MNSQTKIKHEVWNENSRSYFLDPYMDANHCCCCICRLAISSSNRCFGFTAMNAFEPESPSELLDDTKGDAFWVFVTTATLAWLHGDNGWSMYWLPLAMLGTSAGIAFLDFWVSLRGGTNKLKELDKERIS